MRRLGLPSAMVCLLLAGLASCSKPAATGALTSFRYFETGGMTSPMPQIVVEMTPDSTVVHVFDQLHDFGLQSPYARIDLGRLPRVWSDLESILEAHEFHLYEPGSGGPGWGLLGAQAVWEETSNRVTWTSMVDDAHIEIDAFVKGDLILELQMATESGRVTPTESSVDEVMAVMQSIQDGE